jgi:hypothetical protein
MTFEQQVAEALGKPIHEDGWCVNNFNAPYEDCSGRCREISKLLAPRVAAAINLLAAEIEQDTGAESDRVTGAYHGEMARETALAALRGES